jgi:hypothetical protein
VDPSVAAALLDLVDEFMPVADGYRRADIDGRAGPSDQGISNVRGESLGVSTITDPWPE